ncbi:hypothetical protein ACLI4Y_01725 [Natrialbaceae archaeon A-CW3]
MSYADRLEDAGIVLGCAIVVALPMGALFGIYHDGFFLSWWLSLLALTPGTILGLVARTENRLTYTHVWRFGVTHWLTAVVLWQGLGIEDGSEEIALASWGVAFVVGLIVAAAGWWVPRVRK